MDSCVAFEACLLYKGSALYTQAQTNVGWWRKGQVKKKSATSLWPSWLLGSITADVAQTVQKASTLLLW